METLNIRDEDAVRIVEMDRPEALNAFSALLMDELAQAFLDADSDSSIKVLILTGAGRAFSAGADLMEMGTTPDRKSIHGFPGLLDAIVDFSKPFIVAVNGVGAGIGATICGLADLVFISQAARLRCPFSALGLTAEAGSTFTFPQLMGRQRASWFLLSSEWMSGAECVEAGLALEVLAPEALLPRVLDRASILARLPIASLQTTKRLMLDPIRQQLREAMTAENQRLAQLGGGPANREALAAFREKREPDFQAL
jgi:enoyl-CoA hydratase/carnithine racemase